MAWQLSIRQLVAHSLVLCGVIVGGLMFVRSLAPPFPEPLEGVRMEPLSPLIDESEVTPDNGMFLLLPWAKVPVSPRPVLAIEALWRRGVQGDESEIRNWLDREEERIALMRRALAAPEFVWPTNRLDQIEEHLHSLSDASALQMVLAPDGEEALAYLDQGLREAARMYSATLVRLEFVGEEQYRALFRGLLTRWLYGNEDTLEERGEALKLLSEAAIPAWGTREAEKVRWWLATDFAVHFSDWYHEGRIESRERRSGLLRRYGLAGKFSVRLEEVVGGSLECSRERTEEHIRRLYAHSMVELEAGRAMVEEDHPIFSLMNSPPWMLAMGTDPVGRELIDGLGKGIVPGVRWSYHGGRTRVERLRMVAGAVLAFRQQVDQRPELSLEAQREAWMPTWGKEAQLEARVEGALVRFVGIGGQRLEEERVGAMALDAWGEYLVGPYLHWPREGNAPP